MERETLKKAIAGGVVTVALGFTGISFLGGEKEAPAVPLTPRVVKVEAEVPAVKTKQDRVAVATAPKGRPVRPPKSEPIASKPTRHRNRTEPTVNKKKLTCG